MAGIKVLRKVQIGAEGTAGTAVPATNMLVGTGTLEDTREVVFQQADVGQYAGSGNTRTAKLGGKLDYEQEATFEQLPIMLSAAVDDVITGVAEGSGYIYTYEFANTAPKTIKTWTLEAGDNQSEETLNYGYVPSFGISGKGGEPLILSTTWQGAKVAVDAYTTGITVPTVEAVLFSRGNMAIDVSGSAIGTTVKSNTFLGMDLKVDTGWREVWTGDGATDPVFTFLKQVEPNITLDITFEHEGTAVAEKAAWRAETWRKIRLKFLGTALGTPGGTYTYKTFIIDLMGKWTKFEKLDEQDGNDIVHGLFQVKYSDAVGDLLSAKIIVVNEIANITA